MYNIYGDINEVCHFTSTECSIKRATYIVGYE